MTSTNLPAVAHGSLPGLPSLDNLNTAYKLAERLIGTAFVPAHVRSADTVLAIFLHGGAVGLSPTQSLQHISIVEGKPSASAELQRAWVLERGHRIRVVEADRTHAVVWGKRHDNGDEQTVTWTVGDALAAGLIDSANADGTAVARSQRGSPMPWEKHTRNMLIARATTDLCRELFPDVGIGVSYTPDELGAEPAGVDLSHEPSDPPRTVEEIVSDEPDTDDVVDAEIVDEPEPDDDQPPLLDDEPAGPDPAKQRQTIARTIKSKIGDTEGHRRVTLSMVTASAHDTLTAHDGDQRPPVPDDKLGKVIDRIGQLNPQQVQGLRSAAVKWNDEHGDDQ